MGLSELLVEVVEVRDNQAIVFGSEAHLFSLTGWM